MGKKYKNVIHLSFVDLAQRVVKVQLNPEGPSIKFTLISTLSDLQYRIAFIKKIFYIVVVVIIIIYILLDV